MTPIVFVGLVAGLAEAPASRRACVQGRLSTQDANVAALGIAFRPALRAGAGAAAVIRATSLRISYSPVLKKSAPQVAGIHQVQLLESDKPLVQLRGGTLRRIRLAPSVAHHLLVTNLPRSNYLQRARFWMPQAPGWRAGGRGRTHTVRRQCHDELADLSLHR